MQISNTVKKREDEDNNETPSSLYVNNIQPSRHQTSFIQPGWLIFGNCRGGLSYNNPPPREFHTRGTQMHENNPALPVAASCFPGDSREDVQYVIGHQRRRNSLVSTNLVHTRDHPLFPTLLLSRFDGGLTTLADQFGFAPPRSSTSYCLRFHPDCHSSSIL